MKIVVVNTAASSGGAMAILQSFANNIMENDEENEWIFILSDQYIKEMKNIKVIVPKAIKNQIKRFLFDGYYGSKLINKLNPDVVFSMQNTTLRKLNAPQILYLHQALPFQNEINFSFYKKDEFKHALKQKILGFLIKSGLGKASIIIVQTVWMKKAITKYLKNTTTKIEVIPPTIPKIEKTNKDLLKTNHFFYPTSNYPYKNIKILEDVCLEINKDKNNKPYQVILTIDQDVGVKNIISVGEMEYDEVIITYREKVLVFPSIVESYGLPLAEAKEAGSIILAGDTLFSREILNGYENAYFFNLKDKEELKKLMLMCIDGEIELKKVSEKNKKKDGWKEIRKILTQYDLL